MKHAVDGCFVGNVFLDKTCTNIAYTLMLKSAHECVMKTRVSGGY